ncbi:hypothetical protein V12B01_13120 [Vibrio splendidus 12B01]|nr:hypothetical protein V12B01_13120 [Vibrio splendidus 12B01]
MSICTLQSVDQQRSMTMIVLRPIRVTANTVVLVGYREVTYT